MAGFEPATWRVEVCSSTGIRPGPVLSFLARLAGVEPATSWLTARRSTAELQPNMASSSARRGRPYCVSHGDKGEETVSGTRPASGEAFSVWASAKRGIEPARSIRFLVPCSSFGIRRVIRVSISKAPRIGFCVRPKGEAAKANSLQMEMRVSPGDKGFVRSLSAVVSSDVFPRAFPRMCSFHVWCAGWRSNPRHPA